MRNELEKSYQQSTNSSMLTKKSQGHCISWLRFKKKINSYIPGDHSHV